MIEEQRFRIEVPPAAVEDRAAPPSRAVADSVQVLTRGAIAEAIGGGLALVLAIVGLAGMAPFWMAAFATLALGAALVLRAAAIAARYHRLLEETVEGEAGTADLSSGMGVEFLGGAAGIVLALLAMIAVVPWVLLPVAVIVFGATVLVSSGATARLNTLSIGRSRRAPEAEVAARELVVAAAGTQVLIGLAGVILGILGLIGIFPATLTLVGLLCVGASVLLSGAAVSSRLMHLSKVSVSIRRER